MTFDADTDSIIDALREELKENLTKERLVHTENVLEKSLEFAAKYDADPGKITVAALAHDRFRCAEDKELNRLIKKYDINSDYMGNNNLGHGPIAAAYMEAIYGIKDEGILNSIRYHTTGRKGMGLYEKIIFLADATEKGRDFLGVCRIREAAERELDIGVRDVLINTVEYLKKEGINIDSNTVEALKYMDELMEKQSIRRRTHTDNRV